MAWFSALTLIVPVLVVGVVFGALLLWRRRKQPPLRLSARPATTTGSISAVRDVADIERSAQEAEAEGDLDRAAALYESVGMLSSALSIYRRTGNIQKAAELELSSMELGRRAKESSAQFAPAFAELAAADEYDPIAERHEMRTREMPVAYVDEVVEEPPFADDEPEPTGRFASFGEDDAEPTVTYDLGNFDIGNLPPDALLPRREARPPARAKSVPPVRAQPRTEPPPRPQGPTVPQLLAMLGPSPTPDLGNIEIYYRLGLLYLASGNEDMARHAFVTVEDISPGYRDASSYLEQLTPAAPPPERVAQRKRPENQNASGVKDRPGVRAADRFQEVRATATRGRRDDR